MYVVIMKMLRTYINPSLTVEKEKSARKPLFKVQSSTFVFLKCCM